MTAAGCTRKNGAPPVDRLRTHDSERVNWHIIPHALAENRRYIVQHPHGKAMRCPTILPVNEVVPVLCQNVAVEMRY